MKIILQPVGKKDIDYPKISSTDQRAWTWHNYYEMSNDGIKINDIKHLLPKDDYQNLLKIYPDGNAKIWGVKSGQNDKVYDRFQKIRKDDLVIFIQDEGADALGVVAYKLLRSNFSRLIAKKIWRDGDYENIYFVRSFKNLIRIDKKTIMGEIGSPNDYLRDMRIIDDELKVNKLLRLFGMLISS